MPELDEDLDLETDTPIVEPPPRFVTENDLSTFGQTLLAQLDERFSALTPKAPVNPNPEDPDAGLDDYTRSVMQEVAKRVGPQATEAATQRVMQHVAEMNKPLLVANLAKELAGEFGEDVEKEIAKELSGLHVNSIMGIAGSDSEKRKVTLMAKGMHTEKQGKQAPRSGGSGTVGGGTSEESDRAAYFWNNYRDTPGFTKDMAKQWAKEGR